VLRTAGVLLALVALGLAGLLAYPYVRAEMFFLSEGRRLEAADTLQEARDLDAETTAVLRVLPSGEWLLGNVMTMHTPAGYDAIIISASDGTTYTSYGHMCPGVGELPGFFDSLEGDNLDEVRLAIKANEWYSFSTR